MHNLEISEYAHGDTHPPPPNTRKETGQGIQAVFDY